MKQALADGASLRVLLIRKDFKQHLMTPDKLYRLRVLLIRKDFKLPNPQALTITCLRVLLIRKDFKRMAKR